MVNLYVNLSNFTVFLKNRNFTSKIKRSKVTDYAPLRGRGQTYFCCFVVASLCILIWLYLSTFVQLSHTLITQMTCFSGSEFRMPGIMYYSDQKSYFCILSYQIIT